MRLACIDVGTLTCRLLIANVTGMGPIHPLHSDRKILRLGEGVDQDKCLKPEAIARVIETLKEWRTQIDAQKVEAFSAVGTSAVREARNREGFLKNVKDETGMDIEVIDGHEEARRTLLGIRSGLVGEVKNLLALDMGGGSTEFIVSRQGEAPRVTSMDMGVVRVTERCFKNDPPTPGEIHEAQHLITSLTREALTRIGRVEDAVFVGTAGTITTLSAMAQGLATYNPAKVHNYTLHLSTIQNMEKDLFHRTSSERRGIPGLEPGRVEVILAGVLILRCVMKTVGLDQCLVSEYGLREGVLIDLAQRHGVA